MQCSVFYKAYSATSNRRGSCPPNHFKIVVMVCSYGAQNTYIVPPKYDHQPAMIDKQKKTEQAFQPAP